MDQWLGQVTSSHKKNHQHLEVGYLGTTPHPLTVTTRIITFLVGNPYKPSFATVTGWGVDPRDTKYQTTLGDPW